MRLKGWSAIELGLLPRGCHVPDPNSIPPMGFYRGLRRRSIMESLLTDVFAGRLKAGERLVTQTLAERFGVSHTPIREALIGLSGIGVVDLLPNRGAVVRRLTATDVREICQVRRVLESEATRSACGRVDLGELETLADGFRELAAQRARASVGVDLDKGLVTRAGAFDSRLHDLIAASCGNSFLAKELNRLKTLFRAFRDVSYTRDEPRFVNSRLATELGEHLAIVDALIAGDRVAAGRAMSRHILSAVTHWIRVLLATGDAPVDPTVASASARSRAYADQDQEPEQIQEMVADDLINGTSLSA